MKKPAPNRILCVGLTPALQELREFDRFDYGGVNRLVALQTSAAGKGVNVARVLRILGDRPVALGFVGGDTGKVILADLKQWDVAEKFVRVPDRTRVCQTLRDRATGTVTELVEEAALPARPAWADFKQGYRQLVPRAALITISGALMPGAAPGIYGELVAIAARQKVPVIIDSQKIPLLRALPFRPLVAKLNVHELENTVARRLRSPRAIFAAARELLVRGARQVLVTDGARGAWLVGPDGAWHFQPPKLRAVNPIGSGDAVTAGMARALARQESLVTAVRLGMACGAANALTLTTGTVEKRVVAELLRRVRVRPASR